MTKQDFFALGIGHKTTNVNKQTIDCFFPNPVFGASPEEVKGLNVYASGTSEISPSEALKIKEKISPHLVPDALIEADINKLRSICAARGIDTYGHSRNILIEKLLDNFSLLKQQ